MRARAGQIATKTKIHALVCYVDSSRKKIVGPGSNVEMRSSAWLVEEAGERLTDVHAEEYDPVASTGEIPVGNGDRDLGDKRDGNVIIGDGQQIAAACDLRPREGSVEAVEDSRRSAGRLLKKRSWQAPNISEILGEGYYGRLCGRCWEESHPEGRGERDTVRSEASH